MSAPYLIPEDEYRTRVKRIMEILIPKGRAGGPETEELFLLYNDRNTPSETGTQCAGCRARVFNKMKAYYEKIKEA